MELYESNEWMKEGACRDMPPELFFAHSEEEQEVAKWACGSCAVREICREYALEHRIDHGVWGGTDEKTRRNIHRAKRQQADSAA